MLAGELHSKHPVCSKNISNTSDLKILELFVSTYFETSAPRYCPHYKRYGRSYVVHILVHQKVRLSEVIVTDILDSDHLPIIFNILNPVRKKEALNPVEKLTDWDLLQGLASELISPNIQIYSSNEADNEACDFAAPVALTYRLWRTKLQF
jgi:hypothetical protein